MGNNVGFPVGTPSEYEATDVSARTIATGGAPPVSATQGTDTTPVVTETYIAEISIASRVKVTGIAILNGSAVAGNVVVALFNKDGKVVANSDLAGTAQAGAAGLQKVPLTAPVALPPGTYYVGLQCDDTSARFRTHAVGVFGASKKTGETFGTLTKITPPTTFTASLGPVAVAY